MTNDQSKIVLPVIRGLDPNITAAEICSVQPMDSSIMVGNLKLRKRRWIRCNNGEYEVYHLEIVEWIRSHDSALWAVGATLDFTLAFVFTEEMEVWFLLRWA